MGPLPIIAGGGVLLLLVAAASKAKAKTTTTGTTTKPTGTTITVGPGGTAPEYLQSIPYVVAMRVISLSDPSLQQAQGIWLTDNGYPLTGEAVQQYSRGELTEAKLREVARAEFQSQQAGAIVLPGVTITPGD